MYREAGGPLKNVPADNPGLAKLPTKVRNNMGFAKGGGKVMKYKKGGMTEEEKKKKIKKVFAEMKSGKSKIKNPKQAIAIALNSKKKDKKKPMKKGTKNV